MVADADAVVDDVPRQAKVDQNHLLIAVVEENVLQAQVAVGNVALVELVDDVDDALHNQQRLHLRNDAIALHVLLQILVLRVDSGEAAEEARQRVHRRAVDVGDVAVQNEDDAAHQLAPAWAVHRKTARVDSGGSGGGSVGRRTATVFQRRLPLFTTTVC